MLFPKNHTSPPLVAILRGITSDEILNIAEKLIAEDIGYIEVPLNSPDAVRSIEKLCHTFGRDAVCGAGTVLTSEQLQSIASAGAKLALAPDMKSELIAESCDIDVAFVPGVATPTEALAAIEAGAAALKLFPASVVGSDFIPAIRAILPQPIEIIAVGGVDETGFSEWLRAGIDGFGIGSSLYRPGMPASEVSVRARTIVAAYRAAKNRL